MLVSHNTHQIEQMCQRAAWLAHGQLMKVGAANEVVQAYRENQHIN